MSRRGHGRCGTTEFPPKATHAGAALCGAGREPSTTSVHVSRADIARLTGLTRTSVGEQVSDLEREKGLAIDVGRGPSTGGKQPTLVALNANARTIVTLDLGERTFTAALATSEGEIATRTSRDLDGRDGDDAVALVHELIEEVERPDATPILGIGVGTQASSTRPARSSGPSASTARTCRWPRSSPSATACRPSSPTTAAPPPSPPTCSRATPAANLVVIKVGRGIGEDDPARPLGGDGEAAGEIGRRHQADGDACLRSLWRLETVASAGLLLKASSEFSLEGPRRRAAARATIEPSASSGPPVGRWAEPSPTSSARSTRRIALVGTRPALGEPWLEAIRHGGHRSGLAATGNETQIDDGGTGEDVTLLGACAAADPRARPDGASMSTSRTATRRSTATNAAMASSPDPSPGSTSAAPGRDAHRRRRRRRPQSRHPRLLRG